MEQKREYHINNSIVEILFGNILDSQAEVIVSSCASTMNLRGGLSSAIVKAGGNEILEDAHRKLPVNVGDAVVTTAGNLKQKYIFHCITVDRSIDKSNTPEGISGDDIFQYIIDHSLDKCFKLFHVMGLTHIALPAIGTGGAGIPYAKVAKTMSEVVARNLRKTNKALHVEIYLFDCHDKKDDWNFLSFFEAFASQEAISHLLKEQQSEELLSDEPILNSDELNSPVEINKDVFISYSRKDSEIVKSIYERLKKSGVSCWLDMDGMFSGVSYKKVIVDAIKQVKVMLFMSSENSNKSRNVVSEVSVAMERKKKVIPVRLDMSPYSESLEYDLVDFDFVQFDKNHTEESYAQLLKRIASALSINHMGD